MSDERKAPGDDSRGPHNTVGETDSHATPIDAIWRAWHYGAARQWLAKAENQWGKSSHTSGSNDNEGSTDALAAAKIAEIHIMLGDRCGGYGD